MPVKLFVLGLPGSGKSAIARSIKDYVNRIANDTGSYQYWSATRFNDYAILQDLFHRDSDGKRFRPAKPSGFDVIDLSAFNEALVILEQEVNKYTVSLKPEEQKFAIVEFSRNNYGHAFKQFNRSFLADAYFLYLHAEVEVCKLRIIQRVANPTFEEDDHPVSDYIFENYYYGDDGGNLIKILMNEYQVDRGRILIANNNDSVENVLEDIISFVDAILEDKVPVRSVSRFNSEGDEAK